MDLRRTFGLTRSEAAIISGMLDGMPATRDEMLGSLIALDGRLFRDPTVVKVMLCNARRKLAAAGVNVHRGNRHRGPWIDADGIRRIQEMAA